jgi:hypothetical protein
VIGYLIEALTFENMNKGMKVVGGELSDDAADQQDSLHFRIESEEVQQLEGDWSNEVLQDIDGPRSLTDNLVSKPIENLGVVGPSMNEVNWPRPQVAIGWLCHPQPKDSGESSTGAEGSQVVFPTTVASQVNWRTLNQEPSLEMANFALDTQLAVGRNVTGACIVDTRGDPATYRNDH